ncbi:hypothetical protein, partial [Thiolapillus sp.]|uniref:hypothetical protein n=1 Tax=Thiolapillus sp. TaxID=2017437 RepID=UPI003AF9FF0B
MTRTAGAPIGCQRPSRFWGLGCPKIFHEVEDTLAHSTLGVAQEQRVKRTTMDYESHRQRLSRINKIIGILIVL